MNPSTLAELRSTFGNQLRENVMLSRYTAVRLGGPADALLIARSVSELTQVAEKLWNLDIPFILLGGGSNILVSDKGIREVVVINRARKVDFDLRTDPPCVQAESGATPNDIARQAARHSLAGFEWASGIPGTIGGAVYGNAGAFGGEMAGNLVSVELIQPLLGRQVWPVEKMEYGYRTSLLKRTHIQIIILSARLVLKHGDANEIKEKMEDFSKRRRATQPSGASMGSMFKNPTGDKAGRLIEAAGLKGKRIGNAEISKQHANFFINNGETTAADMKALLDLAREAVATKFGVILEPEVEVIGEW